MSVIVSAFVFHSVMCLPEDARYVRTLIPYKLLPVCELICTANGDEGAGLMLPLAISLG